MDLSRNRQAVHLLRKTGEQELVTGAPRGSCMPAASKSRSGTRGKMEKKEGKVRLALEKDKLSVATQKASGRLRLRGCWGGAESFASANREGLRSKGVHNRSRAEKKKKRRRQVRKAQNGPSAQRAGKNTPRLAAVDLSIGRERNEKKRKSSERRGEEKNGLSGGPRVTRHRRCARADWQRSKEGKKVSSWREEL